jgi:acyl-CoA synthetase (AMP-forming)/AMP-acid ligase II
VRLTWPDSTLSPTIVEQLTGPGSPLELAVEDVLGVPMQVFANRPKNLRDMLVSAARRFGDRPYVAFPERTVTYEGMLDPVAAVAHTLRDAYGVGPGDRVAIAAANRVEWAITFWATTALGAITVAMNGWWTGAEMRYALELTTPTVLLGDRRRIERLDGDSGIADLPVVLFEDAFTGMEAAGAGAPFPEQPIAEDDPFLILFTSGTTGRPKGALLSHRSNIHFIYSAMLRGAEGMMRGAGAAAAAAASNNAAPPPAVPCTISASPYFHVSGLNCQLVMATASGMTIVYPPVGKWSERTHLELTEKHRATMWSLVPTQLWRLLEYPELDRYDLSSLRTVGGGSSVWAPELLRMLEARIPHVRPGLGTGYGMTETNGAGTSLRSESTYEHPDSIGQAAPTIEVEVRDPESGKALGEDEVGEICMRSAANFLGYWNNPEATKSALDDERWYHTGDFGHIRDEFVYLEGRRQDLIIRGGENIYPAEIENRLIEHPEIVEVAVVGVDHPTLGQEVAAYVVCRTPGGLRDDDVIAFGRESLAGYKVPTYVVFVESLPHNATGKVMKHVLGKSDATTPAAAGFIEE